MDWETAYENRAAVADSAAIMARWQAEAAAFRARPGGEPERIACGPGECPHLDLFRPAGEPAGLAVYLHGGYWQHGTPALYSHLAAGPLARGRAVAVVGYPLCPDVRLGAIAPAVAAGIAAAAARVPGPLRIAGHSAGGHLACRMLCPGILPDGLLARVAGVLTISGLHDLRPLLRTPLNRALGMDPAEARAESPALLEPAAASVPVTVWAGGAELPELRRQSRILAEIWAGLGQAIRHVEEAGMDHFRVIEALADPASSIGETWLG